MYVNVKPFEKTRTYETPEDAIAHLFTFGIYSKDWTSEHSFGQTMNARRTIDAAIKAKDQSAFVASKRRGYWRVELA